MPALIMPKNLIPIGIRPGLLWTNFARAARGGGPPDRSLKISIFLEDYLLFSRIIIKIRRFDSACCHLWQH
jgi:hypothetical protein